MTDQWTVSVTDGLIGPVWNISSYSTGRIIAQAPDEATAVEIVQLRTERDALAAKLADCAGSLAAADEQAEYDEKYMRQMRSEINDLADKLKTARAELHRLRIRLGEFPECQ